MGVDYRAVIAIGKTFNDKYEAQEFIEQHLNLSDEEQEYLDESLEEFLYNNAYVDGGCLNLYTGNYYYIGHDISCLSPATFKHTFEKGMDYWKANFPNVEPEVINTVMVY